MRGIAPGSMKGIVVDRRMGSKELAPLFLPYGIQAEVKELEFGDVVFEGYGPAGRCLIAVERKRIEELAASIETRRLSGHQLPGMAEQYDYCYLIVEGIWRPGPDGGLQIGSGNFSLEQSFGGRWFRSRNGLTYRAVDNYLSTLELRAGVVYRRSLDAEETVAMVVDLWRWWQEKTWEEHSSHLAVYAPAEQRGRLRLERRAIPLAEKWAMQLPGVDTRARLVANHFGSARAMACATEQQWMEIDGIGKVTAKKAVRAIHAEI